MRQIILILIVGALIFLAASLYASDISVSISGGIEKIDSFSDNGILYFSMSQLAEILGERISWETVGLSAVFSSDDNQTVYYFGSPYIRTNDTVLNITYPVRSIKGALYLPAATFIPILDLIRPEQISWDSGRKLIRIDLEWYNITDLAFSPKANGLLIELFITEPTEYEIYISEGNWLNITVPEGRVNRRQLLIRADKKYIRDMNVEQFEKSAQISVRMRRNIEKYTHRFQANPGRLQISLVDTSKSALASRDPRDIGPDDRIDKIIIDAGHGGKDNGAVGNGRTREKKVVLDIAKRLAKLIRKEKIFEAVMTREKDKYVTLDERTRMANESSGDIFVSIHANASLKKSARGFQVFFLAPALNDEARALVQLENAPFLAEANAFSAHQDDDLSFILSDMIQTEFQTESADLASMIDREFRSKLKKDTRARGIDQAGFYVLNGVYMPSILVESAFLTNSGDEKLLKSKKYRQKVAEAIYAGLKRFKAKYEN
jgi:N-acetylmuramoyl-L-alanine amidase